MTSLFVYVLTDARSESVELWLNAELYDSLYAVERALGFKVYVHDSDETPVSADHYFRVSPGHHYDVTLAKGTILFFLACVRTTTM